ncbi:MAG TPA: hypothetical protein PL009_14960, partial [Flavipsychrobacter sp.]|nr:hypothetical protein [Flavipsychrobacter sp.]
MNIIFFSKRVKVYSRTFLLRTAMLMLPGLVFTISIDGQVLIALTSKGGANNAGAVIEYNAGTNTLIKKADFTSGNTGTGDQPHSSFIQASDGDLYAVTFTGNTSFGGGVVKYNVASATLTNTAGFTFATGYNPTGAFIQGQNAKLYALMANGGINYGTVLEYDIVTNALTGKVNFTAGTSGTGIAPSGSFVITSNGKLYGMSRFGGLNNLGTIVEYDPTTNTLTKKADFDNTSGGLPRGSFAQASNGKLYAMTSSGGNNNVGTVIEYDIATNTLTKKVDFTTGLAGTGYSPTGSFLLASDGKLYAMTGSGGASGSGTVVEYVPGTTAIVKKADFVSGISGTGVNPHGSFMQASNGRLYGMTNSGGTYGYGTVVEYDIQTATLIKKVDFDGINGANPLYGEFIEVSNTWTGAVSSNWNTSGNWSYNAVPSATDVAVIASGTPNAPDLSNTNYTIGNFVQHAGQTLSLGSGNLTVTGAFTNN